MWSQSFGHSLLGIRSYGANSSASDVNIQPMW